LCMDRLDTGDGIIAALQVLAVLVRKGISLRQALAGLNKFPSVLRNVPLGSREDKALLQQPDWQDTLQHAEEQLGAGRILVRPSGTEPLIRILVEGPSLQKVEQVADGLVSWIETRIK